MKEFVRMITRSLAVACFVLALYYVIQGEMLFAFLSVITGELFSIDASTYK